MKNIEMVTKELADEIEIQLSLVNRLYFSVDFNNRFLQ